MGDWGKMENVSIFSCKSTKMVINSAGMLSEVQKLGVARDIKRNSKIDLKIAHFFCFYIFLVKNV